MSPDFPVDAVIKTKEGEEYEYKKHFFKFKNNSFRLKYIKDPNRKFKSFTEEIDYFISDDTHTYHIRSFKNENVTCTKSTVQINAGDGCYDKTIILKFPPESEQYMVYVVETLNEMIIPWNERVTHALRNTPPRLIRHLRDALTTPKDPFNVHENFIRRFPVINYPEFEMWFYRISNGKLGESYDESDSPRLNFDAPRPMKTILEMPTALMDEVLKKLTLTNYLILRKVSTQFRDYIHSSTLNCRSISIIFEKYQSSLSLKHSGSRSTDIRYEDWEDSCSVTYSRKSRTIAGTVFYEQMILDLIEILKMPNLQLAELCVFIQGSYYSSDNDDDWVDRTSEMFLKLRQLLSQNFPVTRKIRVNSFYTSLRTQNDVMSVLPFLEAEVLEEIQFSGSSENKKKEWTIVMNKVVEMEQWKRAKKVKISSFKPAFVDIDDFIHLEEFHIEFYPFGINTMLKFRDDLLQSPIFKSCSIKLNKHLDWNEISERIGGKEFAVPGTFNQLLTVEVDNKSTIKFSKVTK